MATNQMTSCFAVVKLIPGTTQASNGGYPNLKNSTKIGSKGPIHTIKNSCF